MNKKIIFTLVPAMFAFSSLVGCGGGGGGGGGKTLTSLAAALKEPSKVYDIGNTISKSDFIVTATYSDKTTLDLKDSDWSCTDFGEKDTYTFNKSEEIPEKTFYIEYEGKVAACKVNIMDTHFYNLSWRKKVNFGGEIKETTPIELAKKSTEIVFGRTKDYIDVTKLITTKANIGESDNDLITGYFDNTNKKFYILSSGRIMVDDNDTYHDNYGMFDGCTITTSIKFENFDTSKVTFMRYMFNNCYKLISLDLTKFDTSNVKLFDNMFSLCSELIYLNIDSFNTSEAIDMDQMFVLCIKLQSLNLSKFDTSKVKDMDQMLAGCCALESLDLSNFDTSFVDKTNSMFEGCISLTKIYASSSFIIKDGAKTNDMFKDCETLIGGKGTEYDGVHVDGEYARIDDPENNKPGYFTAK